MEPCQGKTPFNVSDTDTRKVYPVEVCVAFFIRTENFSVPYRNFSKQNYNLKNNMV
jgi:hypothetical protein